MTSSKSKKRSAASSASESSQPEPTFFTDRSLGKYIVPEALRAAGLRVQTHAETFPEFENQPEDSDTVWLRTVGERGWVILTKDDQIHRNQIELAELLKAGVPAFVFTGTDVSGEKMAEAFVRAMPQIKKLIAQFDPPFVATVTRSRVRMLHPFPDLIKRVQG